MPARRVGLGQRAAVALLVAAAGAGGADDNHASALATVLVRRHVGWLVEGGLSEGGGEIGVVPVIE
jgi:hypothetical protein